MKSYDLRRELKVIANISADIQGNQGTAYTVPVSLTSVVLIAANPDRKEVIIRNDSNHNMYIFHGATATLTSAIRLRKEDTFIEDKYTGVISGIWDSVAGGGNAEITEVYI
jgi:hypothetical protein